MRTIPLTVPQANKLVLLWHRHSEPIVGFTHFAIGLEDKGVLIGAAIVGRPISWIWASNTTGEVKRLVTNGTPNSCSILYNACWRAWQALGGTRLLTYTLKKESGASLRGAGWTCLGETEGVSLAPKGKYEYTTREQYDRGEVEYLVRPRGYRNDSIFTGVKLRWVVGDTMIPNRKSEPETGDYQPLSDVVVQEGSQEEGPEEF